MTVRVVRAVGVVDQDVADLKVVVVDDGVLRRDRSGVERCGNRERLHDRTRLVLTRYRGVAEQLAIDRREVVRVVRRVARHREDGARLDVHDQTRRTGRPVHSVGRPDLLLEHVLDSDVEGQAQVSPVNRLPQQGRRVRDLAADDVLLRADGAGRPGQEGVFASLDAVLAIAVDVDEAEHLGRERRALRDALDRVDALRLGKHVDATKVKGSDALGGLVADPPLQPHPVAVAGQLRAQLSR